MRTNLDTDPRVMQLASELNLDELRVVGALWKVWSWADSHSLDGNALCVTSETLDRFARLSGFADALRKVGWLEGRDGLLTFPRFAEHNGQTAKKRAETRQRVAKHREKAKVQNSNASVTEKCYQRREEKRREEDNNIVEANASTRASAKPPGGEFKLEAAESSANAEKATTVAEQIRRAWNKVSALPSCRAMTETRMKSLRQRLKDPWWREHWEEGIRRVGESPFCTGQAPARRGQSPWRADIDWFLQPESLTKIIEGKYDDQSRIQYNDNRF